MTTVLVLHDDPDHVRPSVEARFADSRFVYVTRPDDIARALRHHDPQVVFSVKGPALPGPVHRQALMHPSVRWLQVGGSGYDHLAPLAGTRATITHSAGVLSAHLAETVTGAMLALNGHLPAYAAQAAAREWRPLPFRPLAEQTLLVVGLGHVGARVARNARALGMRVLATRRGAGPHPDTDEVHAHAELPALLSRADVVSVHLRLEPATHHLFDAALLARLRRGALFINTSRGPVVDECALVAALHSGHLAGAYLDVFETEPLPASSALWDMPGVIVTPHAADQVADWPARFAAFFADNLARWRAGEPLLNVAHQPH